MAKEDYPDCIFCGERIKCIAYDNGYIVYYCVCEWGPLCISVESES